MRSVYWSLQSTIYSRHTSLWYLVHSETADTTDDGCKTVAAIHAGSAMAQASTAVRWQVLVSDSYHRRDGHRLPDSLGDDQPLPVRVQTIRLTWPAKCRGCPSTCAGCRRPLDRLQCASVLWVWRRTATGAPRHVLCVRCLRDNDKYPWIYGSHKQPERDKLKVHFCYADTPFKSTPLSSYIKVIGSKSRWHVLCGQVRATKAYHLRV